MTSTETSAKPSTSASDETASSASTGEARTVSAEGAKTGGVVSVTSLVLLAILLAAGYILNMTLGNALAIVGIKPQFIIAAYALVILVTRATVPQAIVCALVSAAVMQLTTSVPGLNFLTEVVAAIVMVGMCQLRLKVARRDVTPFVATLLTTLVSGALFAVIGTVMQGYVLTASLAKAPIVLGTAVFNAVVVQALYFPLRKVLRR